MSCFAAQRMVLQIGLFCAGDSREAGRGQDVGDRKEAMGSGFRANKFWDGSSFKMATEVSFEKMQKKMAEIQAAVAMESAVSTGISFEKMQDQMLDVQAAAKADMGGRDKSIDSTGTVVHLSPSRGGELPSEKKGHSSHSTSATFEKMQQKMKEMSSMLSLDSVWNEEDTERVRERERQLEHERERNQARRRERAWEKENQADGGSLRSTSPKKQVAVRLHSRHRGGATPEVVERRCQPVNMLKA
jgi:hypothetical protein|eukprot:Tamp_05387.p1 GENE.Tamp_05387~~Tamp_05387.p1  ORF type:complete len:245 (-),score=50.06 Tamp_05387:1903-2637(-)